MDGSGLIEAPQERRRGEFGLRRAATVAVALLAVVLAFAIRLWSLNDYSFWYDEGFSATMAALPLPDLLATMNTDVHPPLYYLLLKAWMALVGNGEFALRYLSLVAGLLTVVLAARTGSLLEGRRTALLALALAGASPLLVAYAREARMYVFAGLWVVLAACLLLLALRRPRPHLWFGVAVVEAAAIWTHYYTGLVVVFLGIWALVTFARRGLRPPRSAVGWAISQAIVLVSLIPLVGPATGQLSKYGLYLVTKPDARDLVVAAAQSMVVGLRPPGEGGLGVAAAATLLVVGATALAMTDRRRRAGAAFALLWLLIAVAPVIYASTQRSVFHPRYLVQAAPAFCLLLGLGFSRGGRLARLSAAGLLVAGGLFAAGLQDGAATAREDARGVAGYLASVSGPHDVILVDSDQPFRYYGTRSFAPYVIMPDKYPRDNDLRGWLRNLPAGTERVFHLQWLASDYDAKQLIKFYLRSQTAWQGGRRFAGFLVDEYRMVGGHTFAAPALRPATYSFAGVIDLLGVQLGPGVDLVDASSGTTAVSNGLLPVTLNWQAASRRGVDFGAGVVLVDESGRAWASTVQPLVAETHLRTSHWEVKQEHANFYLLPVPLGTAPGEYTVRAFVYRYGTEERLDLVDGEGRPQGTEAEVGRVSVVSPVTAGRTLPEPTATVKAFGELSLTRATVDRAEARQGEKVTAELLWWAERRPAEDYDVRLELVPEGGAEPAASTSVALGGGKYPASRWPGGEWLRERVSLAIPGRTPPGRYAVKVSLLSMKGGVIGAVDAGQVEVKAIERAYTPPSIANPVGASFGGLIELVGFDAEAERLVPDRPLRLTLYWRSTAVTETDYTVFTHLLGPGEVVWGQQDSPPLKGARPTAGWLPGEVLVDRYDLTLRPEAPGGRYSLQVGLYDPQTMARLPVVDAKGQEVSSRVVLLELDLAR